MDNEMELLLRSFDEDLDERDRRRLADILRDSAVLRRERIRLLRLRDLVAGAAEDGFAPGFTDRVMSGIDEGIESAHVVPIESLSRRTDLRSAVRIERGDRLDANGAQKYRSDRPAVDAIRAPRGRWSWLLAGGVAAAAVLAIAIGLMIWMQPRVSSVPRGATQTLTLMDGSTITLSGGSTLSYPRSWGEEQRRVRLDGEAFFTVAPGDRPFVVETFNADVTVLGTQFNVRAWRDDPNPETAVALATGRVSVIAHAGRPSPHDPPSRPQFSHPQSSQDPSPHVPPSQGDSFAALLRHAPWTVVLEPGQTTSVVADSTAARRPRTVSLEPILSWRYGGLAFADQPLGSVLNAIERRFDTDVRAADPAIRDRLLTYLNPEPGSAADVLSDICHTLDLRYRRTATGYEVLPH